MKITVFGATGNVGRRVVAEAVDRGHSVTAVARTVNGHSTFQAQVALQKGDISKLDDVVAFSAGRDVVINATRPASRNEAIQSTTRLLEGLGRTGARLIVVGGAASLTVPGAGGRTVLDDPHYLPAEYRHVGEVSMDQYRTIMAEQTVDWSYLSPPADLHPGSRTGRYRLGRDELLVDADGRSRISMEDLAVALLTEAEQPRHHRVRFTVAY